MAGRSRGLTPEKIDAVKRVDKLREQGLSNNAACEKADVLVSNYYYWKNLAEGKPGKPSAVKKRKAPTPIKELKTPKFQTIKAEPIKTTPAEDKLMVVVGSIAQVRSLLGGKL